MEARNEALRIATRWHIQTTYIKRLRCFQSNSIPNYWLNNINWLSCFQSHHPGHHLTSQPASARNMNGMLSKFDRDVVPFCDDGISEVEQYHSALRTLHSQAVVNAQSNFVPNRVFGTTPPKLSLFECYLS